MKKLGRRSFVKGMGVVLWLPYLEALSPFPESKAYAQSSSTKKHFLALAWPQGAGGENGATGNWHFNSGGYLTSLNDIRANIIIPRGFGGGNISGGYDNSDTTHGNGYSMFTTGYSISNTRTLLRAPGDAKSIDQIIGDKAQAENPDLPLRSLVTGITLENGGLGAVHGDSGKTISWSGPYQPILPIVNMKAMFDKIFSVTGEAMANSQKEANRKKSILDFTKDELASVKSAVKRTPSQYVLDQYLTQVEEIEKYIDTNTGKSCPSLNGFKSLTANLADFDNCIQFLRRSIDLHVIAHQCDLVRSSTITMDTSVSNIGRGDADSYHVHITAECNARYHSIIQAHTNTIGYAIRKFRDAGLLDQSIIYAGTDCALGHNNVNTPYLIAGSGQGFKWGQEIGSTGYLRPTGDLIIDMLKAFGINKASLGNPISWAEVKEVYPFTVTGEKTVPSGNSGILA